MITNQEILQILLPEPADNPEYSVPADPDILCLHTAADALGVRPELLERMAENGEVPGKKFGRDWRFSRAALRRCLSLPKDPMLVMLDRRGIRYEEKAIEMGTSG